MWQAQIEIKHSFNRVAVFRVLLCRTSDKGGTHTCCVDVSGIYTFYECSTYESIPLTEVMYYIVLQTW